MISPRRTATVFGLLPDEHYKMLPAAAKSCESLYSNTSSSKGSASILYRRKTTPIGSRQATLIPATTEVRQRVLSARRLRMKTYQNQLADAQQTIAELAHENRILRTLHKRQDSALAKYESTNAELPQLLHSHAEELRVWQTKYRNLQALNKDIEQKLKQKEAVILSLSDQNKYYSQLNKDKNLDERQRLSEKLQTLEARLTEKDNDIKLMARKVQLEVKNFKQQLLNEQRKTKDLMIKLEKARLEISGYRKLDELNLTEKFSNIALRRTNNCNIEEEPKLKSLNKVLMKSEYKQRPASENVDFQPNQSTSRSNAKQVEFISTRAVNQIITAPAQLSQQAESTPLQRCLDRSDADTRSTETTQIFSTTAKQKEILTNKSASSVDDFEQTDYSEDISVDEKDGESDVHNSEDTDVQAQDAESLEDDEEVKDEDQIIITSTQTPARIKEDISNIRKQISDDYKEREAFLDTFCRQATSSALRDETPKKRNSVPQGHNIPKARKHKLLAALKAIDDNKSTET